MQSRLARLLSIVRRAARAAAWLVVGVSTLAFCLSAWWLSAEPGWDAPTDLSPEQAFREGTLGLEIAPYKLVVVLNKLAPRALIRDYSPATDPAALPAWWQHYGFIDGSPPEHPKKCGVPLGFNVTHLLPGSATPVPTEFVGLTCATCHSQRVHNAALHVDEAVIGAGTTSADVIAFSDALMQAAADPALNAGVILDTYEKECGDTSGFWYRLVGRRIDAFFIDQWLSAFRKITLNGASKYDLPYHGAQLFDADSIVTGPSRTRPFRSVIRNTLDLPAARNLAFSKIPAAFEEDRSLRPASQFDGSIADPVTRSLVAAFASGSQRPALARAPIVHDIRAAAKYTLGLGPLSGIKTFAQVFPSLPAPDAAALDRGRHSYAQYCTRCHGYRPAANARWEVNGAPNIGAIEPLSSIGTDGERVNFRYSDILPTALWTAFPASPVSLDQPVEVPACRPKFTQTIPAGTNLLDAQRAAIDAAVKRAEAGGDFVLSQYWQTRREQFERDRRDFPAGHPLAFTADEICGAATPGYINNPIPLVYLRAPYLHNASVPTMRQLLNMENRPEYFCRGDDEYDPDAMGLRVRIVGKSEACPAPLFKFDTHVPGNSNAGHDYPWRRDEVTAHPEYQTQLRDLLLYLRTQ